MTQALEPKLLINRNNTANIVVRAAAYEDLSRLDGWRDFNAIAAKFRGELADDLCKGIFSDTRKAGVSDDSIRGAIYAIDRLLAIPAEAKVRYDLLRKTEDEISKAKERLDNLNNDW